MSDRVQVKNAASPGQVKEAEKKEKRGRELQIEDMRHLLTQAAGRRTMWRYLEVCGVFKTSFTGNSHTFFNEGMRNVGLAMLADITEASPEAYMQMLKEAKGER